MNLQRIQQKLFDTEKNVYSVIDGAVLPALLGKLEGCEGENTSLFRGELPFDLAEAAPYLVQLEKDDTFTHWLLKESLESTCCIFAYSDKKFIKIRKHFRSFMKIEGPDGKRLLFRFYDPCVLRAFLPVCTPENNDMMFAKVDSYLMLSEKYDELLSFKKPTLKQNKIDYKKNINVALALKSIEIEEPEDGTGNEKFDEDETVLMVRKPSKEKSIEATKKTEMKLTSGDEEIDPDETVLMVRKPKK